MSILVEGQAVEAAAGAVVSDVLQQALSGKKYKSLVAARAVCPEEQGGAHLVDLSAPVPACCTELVPVPADSPEGLAIVRHSTAHVMAAAVKK